eukprot:Phypoly_transcript_09876.p1 GENE.Phypoly_transcript_09876~~Phypoly_transcript_09876.p1  ORF type:complete len:332 (+),score=64.29 Phypoly_transcript_09876:91-1086(+)
MLSSREHNGSFRSARKYAVPYASSPLARDSTMLPMRGKGKETSFSTSNHTHGLGGEAKEAMLRSGLRMKRTGSSLRIVATKGSAILTAAFHHIVHVPDLEVFRRGYTKKEDEFAESIPSAVSPFQFVPKDSDLPHWQRDKPDKIQLPVEPDTEEMDEWMKEMRMKVHIRLVQKQQFANTANPIEHQPEHVEKENDPKKPSSRPPSRGGDSDSKKKSEKSAKGELALDTLDNPLSTKRSPNRRAKDRERKEKHASLPPLPRKPPPEPEVVAPDKPRLPKIASHDGKMDMGAPGTPLFYQRSESIKARRTYSEQDVRRLRTKARNSVGLEPIT